VLSCKVVKFCVFQTVYPTTLFYLQTIAVNHIARQVDSVEVLARALLEETTEGRGRHASYKRLSTVAEQMRQQYLDADEEEDETTQEFGLQPVADATAEADAEQIAYGAEEEGTHANGYKGP